MFVQIWQISNRCAAKKSNSGWAILLVGGGVYLVRKGPPVSDSTGPYLRYIKGARVARWRCFLSHQSVIASAPSCPLVSHGRPGLAVAPQPDGAAVRTGHCCPATQTLRWVAHSLTMQVVKLVCFSGFLWYFVCFVLAAACPTGRQ